MTNLKISGYITSHETHVLFLAFNNDNPFPEDSNSSSSDESWLDIDGIDENNFCETKCRDIFFNFMKPEDSIYETGKAVYFSLQVVDNEEIIEKSKQLANRLKQHIIDIKMINKDYDTFQIAEDYEFSADDCNIIQLSEPSQKEFLNISVYADKKEDATSIEIIVCI